MATKIIQLDTDHQATVISNGQPRPLICWHDLPAKLQADFDYIDEDDRHSARLFMYRGAAYDLHEIEALRPHRVPAGGLLHTLVGIGWHGYQSDTYFSGILVRHVDDGECVIAGRFFC